MSSRQIDYRLRVAKHIERKMIARAFLRLRHFDDLEHYAYIGFGALYFSDFKVLHGLGVDDMTSIERDTPISRFENNAPFACVEVVPGSASSVLPGLRWDRKTITWLDYTGRLDSEMLGDINVVTEQAQSGSVILVTVNENEYDDILDGPKDLSKRIKDKADLPGGKPPATTEFGSHASLAEIDRRMITQKINGALASVNASLQGGNRLRFEQLFYFTYSDNARMGTIGGVFVSGNDASRFNQASFTSLPFVATGATPYRIPRPLLTHKEMMELDAQLPRGTTATVAVNGVPNRTVKEYEKVYRYFPRFVDAGL